MKGELVLVDEIFSDAFEFQISVSPQDFSLNIYVDDEKTLDSQLKNKKSFDYCMDDFIYFMESNEEEDEETLNQIKYIEEHFDNLLESVEYIRLAFEELDNFEFIKKNPIMLSKKIVLNDILEITDYDKLIELMNKYEDIVDKIYVSLSGNQNYVSLLDCYKTMNAIKKQADDIKKLNLSQMETIMYVYDQVRNRVYTYENEDESSFKSRDLSEVMFGDKIVCAGYANIFHTLLHYLGIKSRVVSLRDLNDPESGHARNVVYVQDSKYDIDGVYYFDPTWNSRRKNETNEYLYRYTYFAKTRKFMDEDKKYDFEDTFFSIYSLDMFDKVKKIIESGNYEKLIPYTKSLNYMSSLVTGNNLINPLTVTPLTPMYRDFNADEVLKKFENIFSKFNKELSGETLLNVLNNVRKIEYYQNPELYPYSLDDIYKTFMISKWKFEDKHLDPNTKILKVIFGDKIEQKPIDEFKGYGHESGLFKDVQQVRLTKVLRFACDKRENQ